MLAWNKISMLNKFDTSYFDFFPKDQLSREEEMRIGSLPSNHEDRWNLVTHNIRFIVFMMNKMGYVYYKEIDPVFLFEEMQDSMIQASKSYNGSIKFTSYAVNLIRWRAINALAKLNSPVKFPRIREDNKRRIKNLRVKYFGYTRDFDSKCCLSHRLVEKEIEQEELTAVISQEVEKKLSEREKLIILSHFGLSEDPVTLTHLASTMNVSKERVRQIKNRALKKLSRSSKLKELNTGDGT